MGWLFALGHPRSEVRILHSNPSRASAFFIYFEKSAVCIFRVVLTTRMEHRSRGGFAAGIAVSNRWVGSAMKNGRALVNSRPGLHM